MRSEARIHTSVWRNPDFVALSASAQAAYWMVLSQPDMTMAGTVALMTGRWEAFRTGGDLAEDLAELEDAGFIVTDETTRELWVRSFVKHDGVLRSEKTRKPMWQAWASVFSPAIRALFLQALEDHIEEGVSKGWVAHSDIEDARRYNPRDALSDTPSQGSVDTPSGRGSPRARASSASASSSTSKSVAPAEPSRRRRQPDPIFDAVIEHCGYDPSSLTSTARGAINKAVKQLKEVDATPSQIAARARTYRSRWPDTTISAPALAKHWPQLATSNTRPPPSSAQPEYGSDEWKAREADQRAREEALLGGAA